MDSQPSANVNKKNNDPQTLVAGGFLLLVIVTFISSFFYFRYSSLKSTVTDKKGTTVPAMTLIPTVPPNTHVPEIGEAPKEQGVAIPYNVQNILSGTKNKVRKFNIEVKNGKFTAIKIIVYQNDIVSINFTSHDKEIDLTFPYFGVSQTAKAGETKKIEFSAARSGVHKYLCQSCAEKKENNILKIGEIPEGSLLVVPR